MRNNLISIVICFFTMVSCGLSEEDVIRLATEEYARKVQHFQMEQKILCEKAALIEAERLADSIIFEMRINPLRNTLYRPLVPPKPVFVTTDSSRVNSKDTVKPILIPNRINR